MRRTLIKQYYLRKRNTTKNNEGGFETNYQEAVPIEAVIWSAGGKTQAQMYGERLTYIKNMEYGGNEDIQENDGICVFVQPDNEPDYKVISIKPEYSPKILELERI